MMMIYHHHHRLTAVLSRQSWVSRFTPYHPSPPITVISILNNKAQWLHIHLDGVHPCLLGSSFGFPSFHFQHSTPFYPIIIRHHCTCPDQRNLFLLTT